MQLRTIIPASLHLFAPYAVKSLVPIPFGSKSLYQHKFAPCAFNPFDCD